MSALATIERMSLTPAGLAGLFAGTLEGEGEAEAAVAGISVDSREVAPGHAFVALAGQHDDGHRHLEEAARRGASLGIVSSTWVPAGRCPPLLVRVPDTAAALRRACRRRLDQLGCRVVAITGSVGKTTVKELCAHILGSRHRVGRTTGNLNTWTGVPLSVLRLQGPVDIFVAELAMSAAGEIRDLAAFTRPDLAVVLNVGLAHVGLLGSIEAIAAAKAELLGGLRPGGAAVLNADDPRVAAMAGEPARGAGVEVVTFSASGRPQADWRASQVRLRGLEGSEFQLGHGSGGSVPIRLRVAGSHAVANACAAAAVAGRLGLGISEIAAGLETFRVPEQRGRVLRAGSGLTVYDDSYNSSPDSLAAALEVLAGSGAARRVAVLGDMLELGDRAPAEHRLAGARAAAAATDLLAVGEHAAEMAEAAIAAGLSRERVHTAPDAAAAVALLAGRASPVGEAGTDRNRPGDGVTVLVKGSHALELELAVEQLLR